jgi:hypothetical protein
MNWPTLEPVTLDQITQLVKLEPDNIEPKRWATGPATFDVESWLGTHGIAIERKKPWKLGNIWILSVCPWNSAHDDDDAYVIQQPSGAIAAGCQHNGCADKDWHALRDLLEPGWRESRSERPHLQLVPFPAIPSSAQWESMGMNSWAYCLGELRLEARNVEVHNKEFSGFLRIIEGTRQLYSATHNFASGTSAKSAANGSRPSVMVPDLTALTDLVREVNHRVQEELFAGGRSLVLDGTMEFDSEPDIVRDIIPAFGATWWYGIRGSMKTTLLMHLLTCVHYGMPWLGHETRACPILLLEWEEPAAQIDILLRRIANGIRRPQVPVRYMNCRGRNLRQQIDQITSEHAKLGSGPTVRAIDSVLPAIGAGSEHGSNADGVLSMLESLASLGAGVDILIDHPSQDSRKSGGAFDPRDSGRKLDDARMGWQITKLQDEEDHVRIKLRQAKARMNARGIGEFGVTVDFQGDAIYVDRCELTGDEMDQTPESRSRSARVELIELLKASPGGMLERDIYRALEPIREDTIRQSLNRNACFHKDSYTKLWFCDSHKTDHKVSQTGAL